jgi:hypothetical protein
MASESCWQCGTVLSASGGRCPMCGAEQPTKSATGAPLPQMQPIVRPSRPAAVEPASPGAKKALPWVVLGVGLLAIGVAAAALSPHKVSETAVPSVAPPKSSAEAAPVDPNDLHIEDRTRVDPLEVLGRAKARALAWQKDATLVSIHAEGVALGRVNLNAGGTVEYTFGKPSAPGFGPNARVTGKRLRIALGSQGTTVDEAPPRDASAAPDPTCPIEDAEKKSEAAGLHTNGAVNVTYEVSDKYKKAVWKIASPDGGQVRTVDGWSCVILIR